ncbi:Transcriptional repressor NrdR [bioreactor metagenome]|uniref:Transcriptional repressor NrdR n=2 Tax=root TaxID=1 RepID=A0A645D487_9ZZZZ
MRACEKRPVTRSNIESIVDNIEKTLNNNMTTEISSEGIGEMILDMLKNVDEVAYVRFASVYRKFDDINSFMEEIKRLIKEK